MVASVHRLQFVHSATSMIMFHFFIRTLAPYSLIPAQAGIQSCAKVWIPAFAGMTATRSLRRHELGFLERAADVLVLLHRREGRRHVLGAAIPQLHLHQRIGA